MQNKKNNQINKLCHHLFYPIRCKTDSSMVTVTSHALHSKICTSSYCLCCDFDNCRDSFLKKKKTKKQTKKQGLQLFGLRKNSIACLQLAKKL